MAKLTERQKRFVEFYTGNATEAAIKAGYSKKTAYSQGQRLLKNAEISSLVQERHSEKVASVERRREILTDIAEGENEKAAIKAVDVLNKMDALYIQKVEDVTKYDGMTPEQLTTTTVDEVMKSETLTQIMLARIESYGYKVTTKA